MWALFTSARTPNARVVKGEYPVFESAVFFREANLSRPDAESSSVADLAETNTDVIMFNTKCFFRFASRSYVSHIVDQQDEFLKTTLSNCSNCSSFIGKLTTVALLTAFYCRKAHSVEELSVTVRGSLSEVATTGITNVMMHI